MTIDDIAPLWAENKSVSTIAAELSATRSVIAGKVRRARLKGDERFDRRSSKPLIFTPRPPKPVPVTPPLNPAATSRDESPPAGRPLWELEHDECRFPVNNPEKGGEFLFCGAPAVPDRSYCAKHGALVIGARLKPPTVPSRRALGRR